MVDIMPKELMDQLGISDYEKTILQQGMSSADIINWYKSTASSLASQTGLADITKTQNDLSNTYIKELSDAPWLETLKSKYKNSVDTTDVDTMVKKLRDARDSVYAQLVKKANEEWVVVNPIDLMNVAKQQESIYNNQINTMLETRKARYTSAEDLAKETYDAKSQRLNLLKESIAMVQEQKKEALQQVSEGKADYLKIVNLVQEEQKLQKQYAKEAMDTKISTFEMGLKYKDDINAMSQENIQKEVSSFYNEANITHRGTPWTTDVGIDIKQPPGTLIPSPTSGTITAIGKDKTGNVYAKIKDVNGNTIIFNHLDESALQYQTMIWSTVVPWQKLFPVWNTGNVKTMVNGKWVRLRKDGKIAPEEENAKLGANFSFDANKLLAEGKWTHSDISVQKQDESYITGKDALKYLQAWVATSAVPHLSDSVKKDVDNYISDFIYYNTDKDKNITMSKKDIQSNLKTYLSNNFSSFASLTDEQKDNYLANNVEIITLPEAEKSVWSTRFNNKKK